MRLIKSFLKDQGPNRSRDRVTGLFTARLRSSFGFARIRFFDQSLRG